MDFKKYNKLEKAFIVGTSTLTLLFGIGYIINKTNLNTITTKYNNAIANHNQTIDLKNEEIGELNNKIKDAEPWFEMKDNEKQQIVEQNKKDKEKYLQEQKDKKEQEEKQKYEDSQITYDKIARTPDETISKECTFNGKVVQVIESANKVNLRVAVDGDYDKMLLVEYDSNIVNNRILEKDNVTLYGTSCGTTSYESTLGANITVPAMIATKIELN